MVWLDRQRGFDNPRNMLRGDNPCIFPILYCRKSDVDMPGPLGGFVGIDNFDCRLVIFVYISVGPFFSTPGSSITDRTYFMFFAAVTGALSSASVKLSAVMDSALD